MEDPFDVLGIPRGSSLEEAQRAFRRLSLVCHPDKSGDSAKFIKLNSAMDQIRKIHDPLHAPAQTHGSDSSTFAHNMFHLFTQNMFKFASAASQSKSVPFLVSLEELCSNEPILRNVLLPGSTAEQRVQIDPRNLFVEDLFQLCGSTVVVKAKAHDKWSVNGYDIVTYVPISWAESLVGWSRLIPHPSKEILEVKRSGDEAQQNLVLLGQGLPKPRLAFHSSPLSRGNAIVIPHVVALSADDKDRIKAAFPDLFWDK